MPRPGASLLQRDWSSKRSNLSDGRQLLRVLTNFYDAANNSSKFAMSRSTNSSHLLSAIVTQMISDKVQTQITPSLQNSLSLSLGTKLSSTRSEHRYLEYILLIENLPLISSFPLLANCEILRLWWRRRRRPVRTHRRRCENLATSIGGFSQLQTEDIDLGKYLAHRIRTTKMLTSKSIRLGMPISSKFSEYIH